MALRTLSLLIAAVGVVAGADIPVGGPNPDAQWTTGLAYAPVNATVGDVLVSTADAEDLHWFYSLVPSQGT